MATDIVIMKKKRCCHFFSAVFLSDPFHILAGNDDMHESSDEFEIRPDPTTDCGVSCPLASEKNPHRLIMGENSGVTFSQLFLIKSISCFQVTMTYIRAWMSSKFSHIRSGTTELAALKHLKNHCCPFFYRFTVMVIPGK